VTGLIGVLVGGIAGFAAGGFGWMLFYYLVFMLPHGTPWRSMDQGAILVVFTGPIGAVGGAFLGVYLLGRLVKRKE
ncbi:MAG: hypothetical protein ACYS9X_14125, partial [Planctomycetota bacterium]|jgi:hypothetical protein